MIIFRRGVGRRGMPEELPVGGEGGGVVLLRSQLV